MAAKIPLTRGLYATIDQSNFDQVNRYKWYAQRSKNGFYAARRVEGTRRMIYMHRELLNAPKGIECDHIDHDGLNNCESNLRLATRSQNNRNTNVSSNNKSGFKGVSWSQKRSKWYARIYVEGKQKFLGRFDDVLKAAKAYNDAAHYYFGEFAYLNRL